MLATLKQAPIIFTLFTAAGVLMHDMHIDKAATLAVTLPAVIATAGAAEHLLASSQHTHSETTSFPRFSAAYRSSLPTVKPPRDDERHHIQDKKLQYTSGGDAVSLWPSV